MTCTHGEKNINPNNLKFGFAFIYHLIAAIFITQRDTITRKFLNEFDSLQIVFITSFSVMIFFGFGMFLNYKPINLEIFIKRFIIVKTWKCNAFKQTILTLLKKKK